MPVGLETYINGVPNVTLTSRTGRPKGMFNIPRRAFGQIIVPREPGERIFYALMVTGTVLATSGLTTESNPNVFDDSGNRLTYNWQEGEGSALLLYGVY